MYWYRSNSHFIIKAWKQYIFENSAYVTKNIQIVYITQTDRLMMFRNMVAVYAEIYFHSFVHLVVCFTTDP